MIHHSSLHDDGYVIIPELVSEAEAVRLLSAIDQTGVVVTRAGGLRNLAAQVREVARLARSEPIRALVGTVLQNDASLVRSILFDKPAEANWNMPWHQDVTIAVHRRIEVPGYTGWSVKAGVASVHPPADVLHRMISIRVHLDPCGAENGALRLIPGSHRHGRLDAETRRELIRAGPEVTCSTGRGGALMMRPLLLHASSPATQPRHRRIIHLDYACGNLAGGLEWSPDA